MKTKARSKKSKPGAAHHFRTAFAKAVPIVAVLLLLFAALAVFERIEPRITGFAVRDQGTGVFSPADRITEDALRVAEDAVMVKIPNATIGRI
ncbi:hypothetical protein HYU17_05195 [Candidatus Woesearchaeota archaeon]|nr:hypothetical protein [Candidatus Woesearchaeota archaeon]